jgi:hypothetical protein
MQPPRDTSLPPAPADGGDPARFNRTVRALLFSPGADASLLRPLRDLYTPEALVLAVELARWAGNPASESMAAMARARYPGLGWWLDDIAKGTSRVSFHRAVV